MAKKEETISMVDSFSEFKELKNIDKTTMISVLEESFRNVLAKMFGSDENFVVIMNPDKGSVLPTPARLTRNARSARTLRKKSFLRSSAAAPS